MGQGEGWPEGNAQDLNQLARMEGEEGLGMAPVWQPEWALQRCMQEPESQLLAPQRHTGLTGPASDPGCGQFPKERGLLS